VKYRFSRPAGVIVGLYLTAAAVAAVLSWQQSSLGPVWLAATWSPPGMFIGMGLRDESLMAPIIALMALVTAANAWMLWQCLRGPRKGCAPVGDGRVRWLRRMLYANTATAVLFWMLLDRLPDELGMALDLLIWAPVLILFPLVITQLPRWLRAVFLVAGALVVVDQLLVFIDPPSGVVMAGLVIHALWMVLVLAGQWRDSRWTHATFRIGVLSLVSPLLLVLASLLLEVILGGDQLGASVITRLLGELDVFAVVWLARSAHELAAPPDARPMVSGRSRLDRPVAAAGVLVLGLGLLGADATVVRTYTGWDYDCQGRRYGDTAPADRQRAFLCRVREEAYYRPEAAEISDQELLAYGRAACTGKPQGNRSFSPEDLVFLCPEVMARKQPDLLKSEKEQQEEWEGEMAAESAQCADPWPRVRAARTGTAMYYPFADGGGSLAFGDGEEGDYDKAMDRAYKSGVAGSSGGMVVVPGPEYPYCVTVKAFTSRQPLRLKGWDGVVDMGIVNRTGKLTFALAADNSEGIGVGKRLPNLAVDGPGRYRVRVYYRYESASGGEQCLIVVYPGRSLKTIVHRKAG
jgi:hypothetical protein